MENSTYKELITVAQTIFDKKGFNIIVLDVRNVCNMTDYFIIAEGNVDRHVRAIAKEIIDVLRPLGLHHFHVDGEREGDWIVLDYSDVVIHLFTPELREKYSLENLWKEGKIVDIPIELKKEVK